MSASLHYISLHVLIKFRETQLSHHEFSPFTEPSLVPSYALVELKFVWALAQFYHLTNQHKYQIFLFNISQMDALSDLAGELDKYDRSEDLEALVLTVLQSPLQGLFSQEVCDTENLL